MNSAPRIHFFLARLMALVVLAAPPLAVWAQADPPARVARLNLAEGPVTAAPAGEEEWTDAQLNRPLTRGDRLWTDKGSRADIQVGSAAVRMDGQSRIEFLAVDDRSTQLSLTQGTLYVRVRNLPEGENFEIDTPNLAYRAAYPGDYRIDVDGLRGTTRVTIHSGTGAVYGEAGQTVALGGGQQVTFRGRTLAQVGAQESPPQDNFDRWAAERNRREDQSLTARRLPREVVGYQHLDTHGQWGRDATFGDVWFPQGMPAEWAPYRQGRWEWIQPWGWTWIDDAPWGFAPFHYGRWALIGSRWAWVPGRIGLRPAYAPALVAFVGGSNGNVNWANLLGGGRPAVAWFPLGPGEPWQPGYRASAEYLANINQGGAASPASYAYQRKPEALTAIPSEDFHRGRPMRGGWLKVATQVLTNAQVVPPPAMPERAMAAPPRHERPVAARAATPAATPAVAAAKPAEPVRSTPKEMTKESPPTGAGDAPKIAQAPRAARAPVRERAVAPSRNTPASRIAEGSRRTGSARRGPPASRVETAQSRREQAQTQVSAARQRQQAQARQVEQARRAQREETARRAAQERQMAQREAWERQQQAISEQWRRDHQAWEAQQRARGRQRTEERVTPPEVWQRGVPVLNAGPTS